MFYYIAKYFLMPFIYLLYRVRVTGIENIPKEPPFIACANHMAAIDPVLIGVCMPFRLYPMAKSQLFRNKAIGFLLSSLGAFPVKRGEADLKSIKIALKYMNEKKILGIFPEGTRNKTDQTLAEPGIAMLAIRAKVPVLPITIKSSYKFFKRSHMIIGKPIYFDEYFDRKLHSDDYTEISMGIMKTIKSQSGE